MMSSIVAQIRFEVESYQLCYSVAILVQLTRCGYEQTCHRQCLALHKKWLNKNYLCFGQSDSSRSIKLFNNHWIANICIGSEEKGIGGGCNQLQIIYRMNKILEEHAIRLEIHIKEVTFNMILSKRVTFSVSFDGKTLSQSRKSYAVDGDRCLPFERQSCELTMEYNGKKNFYFAKQLILTIHFEDVNGREGRRTVKFDPFAKRSTDNEWRLPAQGSSDFQINFATSFSIISKKTKSSQISSNLIDTYMSGNQRRESNVERKTSAINELIKTEGESKRQSQVKEHYANKTRKLENIKSVPIDHKKRNAKNKITSPRYAEQSDETAKPNDELDNLRRKIELEREEKVRSISKLKMEISPNFLGQFEKNQEATEISKLKEKIRNYQRKEKSFLTSIQQLTSQLQKRKTKIGELQGKRQELEKGISQRQLKLKSSQSTIRTLTEQLDGLTTKERVNSKKGEAKEAALREQIRKLEEKMRITEVEIAKANEEKNSSIKGIQFCQKIHQNALREKDIKISEEKTKFHKLKEQFSKKQKQFSLHLEQLTTKTESLQYEKTQAQQRLQILNENFFNLENELAAVKESIKQQRLENERLIEESSDKAYGDINSARIKYNDLTTQNNLLKQRIKRLQTIKTENDSRIKQLEELIKTKNNEISKIFNKINLFKQDLDSVNEDNIRKLRQIQGLKQSNATLKTKLAESKEKYEEERIRKDEANSTLERQVNEFNKQIQSYQAQIKDLKWAIVRNNDSISQLEYQLKEQGNTILKLNEQIMSKTQKYSSLEENLRQSEHQSDQYEREKNSLAIKIKQLNQIIKIKNLELDEEKKLRIKADQRADDEKEKNRQYLSFNRQKEIQEAERAKEKEALLIRQNQEISTLELQITKRKEEYASLKSSNQSVLREIQLSKMDNDNVKSELNLMESNYKALKLQNVNLIKAHQAVNINLSTTEQNLAIQHKKYQQLHKQFQQYKNAIERALENLLAELFKEQTSNSNVIAATLFPFPSQKLSNLQIELVQKRNAFIIKSRQKLSDLENQVDLLEHQIQEITHLYQNRQEANKRQDSEEREKLKGLLYENMLEKNSLAEDLVIQRKEREELEKEIEKLKGEIFRREDFEQELNGQLQILILEYEGMKSQNQDLNHLLFKHKEMEAKNMSEYEQRISLVQEETALQIEKLKIEGLEKEKKIIQLEKDLLDFNEKTRKLQEEKLKINGHHEILKQNNKIFEDKLSYNNIEITKLNNSIKSLQKRQSTYRDSIDRLENEISQQRNKCEVLQSSLNTVTSEHFQTNIDKQKLTAELANLKQRCSELEKMLYEKGEVSKQRIQKKMEENSQLKSLIIQKTSDLELKDFHIKQKEQQNQGLIQENQDLKKSNSALKARLKELMSSFQSSQSRVKELGREVEQLLQQRQKKQDALSQTNFFIMSLQNEIEQMNHLNAIIQNKEKECIQLRETKNQTEEYYMSQLKKSKQVIGDLKKQIKSHRVLLQNLEDEYKGNLETLSKTNNQRCRSLQTEFILQKDDFSKRVEQIQAHNKRVIAQYEFRIEKLKEDLDEVKENERNLIEEGVKKQASTKSLVKKIEQLDGDLEEFKQKYNRYYHLYLQNKAQIGQNLKENQNKMLNTMEKSKISQLKQYSFKLAQIERKIQRLRHSEQLQLKSQTVSRRQIKQLIDRIFSKLSQYIKDADIEVDDVWESSKIDSHLYGF